MGRNGDAWWPMPAEWTKELGTHHGEEASLEVEGVNVEQRMSFHIAEGVETMPWARVAAVLQVEPHHGHVGVGTHQSQIGMQGCIKQIR